MKTNTKKLCVLAVIAAIAFLMTFFSQMLPPMFLPFLRYDPKDIIITIGGFLFGPLAALDVTAVVALVEMVTISPSGPIGLIMNVVSGGTFACTAAFIYKKKRTLAGAAIGLVAACLLTTAVMLLWNYLIVPLYMEGTTRERIAPLLFSAFLPFNLLKGGLNAALTMLLYKPIKTALLAIKMVPSPSEEEKSRFFNPGVLIVSLFVVVTCVLWMLAIHGII